MQFTPSLKHLKKDITNIGKKYMGVYIDPECYSRMQLIKQFTGASLNRIFETAIKIFCREYILEHEREIIEYNAQLKKLAAERVEILPIIREDISGNKESSRRWDAGPDSGGSRQSPHSRSRIY